MSIEIDETLQVYIDESIEHLADIENDLLAIEEAGADLDEDLVNKVYRAAHSIKGGAGFMGLTNIKDLTHEMENILGMIRSREMVPNSEVINILLLASDVLRNLVNNLSTSNEVDILEHIEALKAIAQGTSSQKTEEPVPMEASSGEADISFPGGEPVFKVAINDFSDIRAEGKCIYLIEMELIQDIHEKDKTPSGLLDEMLNTGSILDSKIDVDAVGELEEEGPPKRIPFVALFASILKPNDINALFEIDEKRIFELAEDMTVRPISEPAPPEPIVSEAVEPRHDTEGPIAMEELAASEPPVEEEPVEQNEVHINAPEQKDTEEKASSDASAIAAEANLRVNVILLDSLMTLAGELVLGRNQLLQSIATNDQRVLENAGQRIDLITSELQEAIMLTRMQPIGNVFNKFPRVVRDLAGNLGKQVKLDLQGKEVELDKTIIEAINDPLTHLVRNSVDHGIEKPEDRKKMRKNITGSVLLRAYHEAGQVSIEISDDGRGLDGNKLAAAAVAKGLITEDQAKAMSDKERVNLIFLPGFSTADKVTDVSGRGVGMDVVKTNLDKLGGVVDIDSSIGKGTTINIKLPLTLAIIPSQIISTGGERYAIPQVNMEELLRIPADQVKKRVEKVGDAEVVRLRGDLLPLIKLADIIGVELTYLDPEENELKSDRRKNIADRRSRKSPLFNEDSFEREQANGDSQLEVSDDNLSPRKRDDRRYHADSALNIVVVSTGAMKYGLVVDQLHDSEEIVVKPLGRDLKQCKGYAGATIMGDGRVALILDVANLALMAELTSLDSTDRAAEVAEENAKIKDDKQSLLLFRSSEVEQFGVSLNQVQRIEKIKVTDIEEVGGKRIMQYRGGSLPLFSIDEVAQVKPLEDREDILVIVFTIAEREIGLLAIGPVDAVETALDVDEMSLKQPGILGSAIIGKHTTQLVDVFGLVHTVKPEWFPEGDAGRHSSKEAATILFAEDSDFFRNQVKSFMEEDGYNVIEAEDGMIAWDLLQENADKISLVVTDIEMPNLNGFELTRMIRQDERYSDLPVVALTTLASDEDISKGKDIGINDYQIKLDKEKLMTSVQSHLIRK